MVGALQSNHPSAAVRSLCVQVKGQWTLVLRKVLVTSTATWAEYPLTHGSVSTLLQNRGPANKRKGGHAAGAGAGSGAGAGKAMGVQTSNGAMAVARELRQLRKDGKGGHDMTTPRKRTRQMPTTGAATNKSSRSSIGIGKGRKICHHCNEIVGSPSRVCPFCKGDLPLKTSAAKESASRA